MNFCLFPSENPVKLSNNLTRYMHSVLFHFPLDSLLLLFMLQTTLFIITRPTTAITGITAATESPQLTIPQQHRRGPYYCMYKQSSLSREGCYVCFICSSTALHFRTRQCFVNGAHHFPVWLREEAEAPRQGQCRRCHFGPRGSSRASQSHCCGPL